MIGLSVVGVVGGIPVIGYSGLSGVICLGAELLGVGWGLWWRWFLCWWLMVACVTS